MVNILGIAGHTVYVAITQLWCCSTKAAMASVQTNEHDCSNQILFTKTGDRSVLAHWLLFTDLLSK